MALEHQSCCFYCAHLLDFSLCSLLQHWMAVWAWCKDGCTTVAPSSISACTRVCKFIVHPSMYTSQLPGLMLWSNRAVLLMGQMTVHDPVISQKNVMEFKIFYFFFVCWTIFERFHLWIKSTHAFIYHDCQLLSLRAKWDIFVLGAAKPYLVFARKI